MIQAPAFVYRASFRKFSLLAVRLLHLLFCVINILEVVAVHHKSIHVPLPFFLLTCLSNFACALCKYSTKTVETVPQLMLFTNFYIQATAVLSIIVALASRSVRQKVGGRLEVLQMGMITLIAFHVAFPVLLIAVSQFYDRVDAQMKQRKETFKIGNNEGITVDPLEKKHAE